MGLGGKGNEKGRNSRKEWDKVIVCPCSHSTRGSALLLTLQSCLLSRAAGGSAGQWCSLSHSASHLMVQLNFGSFWFCPIQKSFGKTKRGEGRQGGTVQILADHCACTVASVCACRHMLYSRSKYLSTFFKEST